MHHHLEIIMPSTDDIEKAISAILKPFNEDHDAPEDVTGNEFWDWYVVGGRFAGTKETCRYGADKIEKFRTLLMENDVTVSGVQVGKETLNPSSQIQLVDKLWNDLFPTENGEITPCPLFSHSNNQYDSNDLLFCDICKFDEIPQELSCDRVIIAAPTHNGESVEGTFMLCDDQWNGINHMKIDWDGKVLTALNKFKEKLSNCMEEYAAKMTPDPSWICVTVDYHS